MDNKPKTVLIVDDEELLTKALAKKLEVAGYEAVVQRNGEEGLKFALASHPSLVLLDMIMPVMDGMTFLDKLRADEWGKTVPVIVLTNLETGEEVARSKGKDVYDYLVKTNWSLADVLQKVDKALGK